MRRGVGVPLPNSCMASAANSPTGTPGVAGDCLTVPGAQLPEGHGHRGGLQGSLEGGNAQR